MTNNNQHIIQKVNAELSLPSADKQVERSAQLKTAIYESLEKFGKKLDQQLDETACRIDYLSVDISLDEDHFSQLANRLEQALAEKVLKAGEKVAITGEEASIGKVNPSEQRQELLSHFLETGRLPWWADEHDTFDKMEQELKKMDADALRELINSTAEHNDLALSRITEQFPEETVRNFLKKYAKQSSEYSKFLALTDNFSAFLDGQDLAYGQKKRLITEYYTKILTDMVDEQPHQEIIKMLLKTFIGDVSALQTEESPEELLQASDLNRKEKLLQLLEDRRLKIDRDEAKTEELNNFEENVWSEPEGESLNVSSSGLVLLHPFIARFFENLGLLEEGAFTGDAARERAVCLLHYLATGNTEFLEPAMILPKFLCAWPLECPVNRFLLISDYEKEECDAVLNSAIEHWEALKSTSIEGLRGNLLQREGLLREEEFGWSLHIEPQTQDILLEKLPWGLSVVKFPWMNKMLTVNWI